MVTEQLRLVDFIATNSNTTTGMLFIANDLIRLSKLSQNGQSKSNLKQTDLNRYIDLFILLQISISQGNLCLSSNIDHLKQILEYENQIGNDIELEPNQVESICNDLAELIGSSSLLEDLQLLFDKQILVTVERNSIVYLYPGRYYRSLELLKSFTFKPVVQNKVIDDSTLVTYFQDVLVNRPIRIQSQPANFTVEQKLAMLLGLTESFFVVSGGPGTGKTTLVVNILRLLVRSGVSVSQIRLAAPTGKAAARLKESITESMSSITDPTDQDNQISNISSSTLHGLLQINSNRSKPLYSEKQPLHADVVIVDEASMIDITMMSYLLSAIDSSKTKLILIGDKDQLPSVEAGLILSDILYLLKGDSDFGYNAETIERAKSIIGKADWQSLPVNQTSKIDRSVFLTKSHRSEMAIRNLSICVQEGFVSKLKTSFSDVIKVDQISEVYNQEAAIQILPTESDLEINQLIQKWAELTFTGEWHQPLQEITEIELPTTNRITDTSLLLKVKRLFEILNSARILTVVRKTRVGVESINQYLAERMAAKLNQYYRFNRPFRGLPILIRRNDHLRQLSNGDTGIVIEFKNHRLVAVFEDGRIFGIDLLPEFEPAYSMTVHKSQGSEYGRVLLVLPENQDHPLVKRQLLYTGITRAKRLILIYGSTEVIEKATLMPLIRLTGIT